MKTEAQEPITSTKNLHIIIILYPFMKTLIYLKDINWKYQHTDTNIANTQLFSTKNEEEKASPRLYNDILQDTPSPLFWKEGTGRGPEVLWLKIL